VEKILAEGLYENLTYTYLTLLPSACQVLPLNAGSKEMEKLSEKV
jgi:hypothetical protein